MELDLQVQTNNNIDTIKGVDPGACFAMTLQWIKASKRYGGVTRSWQIGNTGSFRIMQSRYDLETEVHDRAMIKRAGLTIQNEYNNISTFATVAQSGYHVIGSSGGGGGHAMGSWVNHGEGQYQFFDPNNGLYRAADGMQLINDVTHHIKVRYVGTGVNASWTIYKIA
jgi:hypothetical protein